MGAMGDDSFALFSSSQRIIQPKSLGCLFAYHYQQPSFLRRYPNLVCFAAPFHHLLFSTLLNPDYLSEGLLLFSFTFLLYMLDAGFSFRQGPFIAASLIGPHGSFSFSFGG